MDLQKSVITARLNAMIEQCHNRNPEGSCGCQGQCKSLSELLRIKSDLESQLSRVQVKLKYVSSPPCTLIAGWSMPSPPNNKAEWRPTAYLDGDEWWMHWCDETTGDVVDMECEWPFQEQTAYSDDFIRIGFDVQ